MFKEMLLGALIAKLKTSNRNIIRNFDEARQSLGIKLQGCGNKKVLEFLEAIIQNLKII